MTHLVRTFTMARTLLFELDIVTDTLGPNVALVNTWEGEEKGKRK